MVRLELASKPECGILVRAVLAALGKELGWERELIDDVKTAVTEACNNVVMHAYHDTAGRMVVRLDAGEPFIEVVVCDQGEGLHGVTISEDHLRVGLPIISSLADRSEFLSPAHGGTEVRMFFSRDSAARKQAVRAKRDERIPPGEARRGPDPREIEEVHDSWTGQTIAELAGEEILSDGDVVAAISPVELVAPALGRLIRALAAVHHFGINRFASLGDMSELLARRARTAAVGRPVAFSLTGTERRLELIAGPFGRGIGDQLVELRGLVDELAVHEGDRGELLRLVIADAR